MKKTNYIIIYLFKWLLKRFGYLKSIFMQLLDKIIYQKESQFLLHPWCGHRTPFQVILYYNRLGRILFATQEFIALLSHGKFFKKRIALEGYEVVENIKEKGDYSYLWPQSPLNQFVPNKLSDVWAKKMEESLILAYQLERETFDKTVEWNRVTSAFKKTFFHENGEINREEIEHFRYSTKRCIDIFNDQFFYVDLEEGYVKSYLKAIDLILEYHRNAKVINKELLASVSESSVGGSSFLHYRGQKISEKLLFHTLITNDIVNHVPFDKKERNVVVDIGSGYGGLDRLLAYYVPNSCFVLIDLPETLLLTAYFIEQNFPNKKIALLSDISTRLDDFNALVEEYDFIIVPPSVVEKIPSESVKLVTNSASLGFMEEEYVEYYLSNIYRILEPLGYFYSLNKEYNDELGKGSFSWDFKGKYLTRYMAYNNRFSYAQWLGQKV